MDITNAAPRLRLAELFALGKDALIARFGTRIQPHQQRAMLAILACRTAALGSIDCRNLWAVGWGPGFTAPEFVPEL